MSLRSQAKNTTLSKLFLARISTCVCWCLAAWPTPEAWTDIRMCSCTHASCSLTTSFDPAWVRWSFSSGFGRPDHLEQLVPSYDTLLYWREGALKMELLSLRGFSCGTTKAQGPVINGVVNTNRCPTICGPLDGL